jgi:hypothetical protein
MCDSTVSVTHSPTGFSIRLLRPIVSALNTCHNWAANPREQGLALVTTVKKNMKPVPRTDFENAVLHRRSLVETVIDELKNLCQIEHTRCRSVASFLVNLMADIVGYCLSKGKPTFNLIRTGAPWSKPDRLSQAQVNLSPRTSQHSCNNNSHWVYYGFQGLFE